MRLTLLAAGLLAALSPAASAQTVTPSAVEGTVTERATGGPIPGANVTVEGTNFGTATADDGTYRLPITAGRYLLVVSAVGYQTYRDSVVVERRQTTRFDARLRDATLEMDEAVVEADAPDDAGAMTVEGETIDNVPSQSAGDGLQAIKTFFAVNSANETSNTYSVRGGGINENLIYLDGFEVYLPQRTRQGEQEGLSVINADLVQRLTLYAGGFPARYGGKLSSALDVTYKKPRGGLDVSAYTSTLDAGATVGTGLFGGRGGLALGVRSASAGRFFGGQELKGDYNPSFADVQGLVTAELAPGHDLYALGILARHRFSFDPNERVTSFGAYPAIQQARLDFEGSEEDGYDLGFGGLRLRSQVGLFTATHLADYFELDEREEYDITAVIGRYAVSDPNQDPDAPGNLILLDRASRREFADNRVLTRTLTGQGRYGLLLGRHALETGWHVRRYRFEDRIDEFDQVDGIDQETEEVASYVDAVAGQAALDETQLAFHVQDAVGLLPDPERLVVTLGVRAEHFSFNDEWTVSPRFSGVFQLSETTTLQAAAGLYYQPPGYRELRGFPESITGTDSTAAAGLNTNIESQRAALFTFGGERFFTSRRFYVRAEGYYKSLSNLVSYDVDNTRIVYSGQNDTEGYAYGFDLQVRGELVPGLESWLNYGFLVTDERYTTDARPFGSAEGYTPRPTDRRHNFSLFVQDYVPGSDDLRLYLRALFGTGSPYTAPARRETGNPGEVLTAEPGIRHNDRFLEYRRFDMGATKELVFGTVAGKPIQAELSAEVLNVFNMKNTVSQSYIPVETSTYGWQPIPTRLTPRLVNVRFKVTF
jgi:hypothetical protein